MRITTPPFLPLGVTRFPALRFDPWPKEKAPDESRA